MDDRAYLAVEQIQECHCCCEWVNFFFAIFVIGNFIVFMIYDVKLANSGFGFCESTMHIGNTAEAMDSEIGHGVERRNVRDVGHAI